MPEKGPQNQECLKKEHVASEALTGQKKALEVEVRQEALKDGITPEKGPPIQECRKVEHVENRALASLEVGTILKDGPCVD